MSNNWYTKKPLYTAVVSDYDVPVLQTFHIFKPPPPESENEGRPLLRRFGLLQATALNMSNMIGIGPFITIPLLMSAIGGPQAMLGWLIAV